MPKLTTFHHTMIVEGLKDGNAYGKVTLSNFLEEGEYHSFPVHQKIQNYLEFKDKLRITFFASRKTVEDDGETLKFKYSGVKYEIWNTENEGWDMIFEEMSPPDKDL